MQMSVSEFRDCLQVYRVVGNRQKIKRNSAGPNTWFLVGPPSRKSMAASVVHQCPASKFSKKNLYEEGGEVLVLNTTNFDATILVKPQAFLIQFYNSWCGHCQAFADTYKKLALGVKEWKSVIAVAAIDCAETDNVETCREYEVTAFPTLKLFPPNNTKSYLGKLYEDTRDIDAIQNAMIDFVSTGIQNPPDSWPDLLTVSHADLKSMWVSTPSNKSWVAVVVEAPDSYLGRDIILSTQYLQPYFRIARAIKDRAPFLDSWKNLTAPYMLIARRGDVPKTFTDSDQVREPYIQYLEAMARNFTGWKNSDDQHILEDNRNLDRPNGPKNNNPETNSSPSSIALSYESEIVSPKDFDNVVRHMLWQEVGLYKNITGDKLSALKTFMAVMVKYLPCSKVTKQFLRDVNAWLQPKTVFVSVEEMLTTLQDLKKLSGFDETMKPWIGCQGSEPRYRGYPCGLWVTFHSLTVGHYLQYQIDSTIHHHEVLFAIRQYVTNLFSCSVCVEHFKKMSSNFSTEVTSIKMSVLWLWQAHNQVNNRLKGDHSEDPLHPKVEFPPNELCDECRVTTNDVAQWSLDDVRDFLIERYSSVIIDTAGEASDGESASTRQQNESESVKRREIRRHLIRDSAILRDDSETYIETTASFNRWGFLGPFDTSLCIVLYLASIGLLILCYCFILTRRRTCLYAIRRNKMNLSV